VKHLLIILSLLLLSSPVIGQSSKPLGVVLPPTVMGNVSDTRKQILLNTLDDELSQYFDVSPPTNVSGGNLPVVEDVCSGGMAIMPMIGRARLLRMWGGVMDMSMDGSPFIDSTEVKELFFNGGWCYGGFKATPASGYCYAHLLATDVPHEVATAYRLDRFRRGAMIDEKGVGPQPNLH